MATPLQRWWTSLGHSVHSPTAFRLITLVLDQLGIAYYPEHLEELPEGADLLDHQQKQLALQPSRTRRMLHTVLKLTWASSLLVVPSICGTWSRLTT